MNNLNARPIPRGPIVDKDGNPSRWFRLMLTDLVTRADKTTTNLGEIQSVAPILGRTEGISTTVGNITAAGKLNSLLNVVADRNVDNVADGVTYGRPLQAALNAGQVDLSKAGVIGPLGSAKINQNVMFNYSNNATVDSIDNGTNATVRVYGPGGVGTTWHQIVGSVAGAEQPAFSGTNPYNQDIWVYYDGAAYHIATTASPTLADGLLFAAFLHTVSAGGGGGTPGGGGSGGSSGGRLK